MLLLPDTEEEKTVKRTENHPYSRHPNTFNYPRPNLDEAEYAIALRETANLTLDEVFSLLYMHCALSVLTPNAGIQTDADGRYYQFNPRNKSQARGVFQNLIEYVEFGLNLKPQLPQGLPLELLMLESAMLHYRPFDKFNAELTQLVLMELLIRRELNVPYLDLRADLRKLEYLAAIRLFRHGQDRRLTAIWERRYVQETESIKVY